MTNDIQRQVLADELNDVSQSIDRYKAAIAKLERQLAVKKARLEALTERKAKLEEGIDW